MQFSPLSLLGLALISSFSYTPSASAAAMINLSTTVNGPGVLQETGFYRVEYRIQATNTGDATGIYDISVEIDPVFELQLVDLQIEYNPGGETQTGTFEFLDPIVRNEDLAPGNTEAWTLTVDFAARVFVTTFNSRGRGGKRRFSAGLHKYPRLRR